MTILKGRYINLRESVIRKNHIEHQLRMLGISHCYSQFEAIKGNITEASTRQLEAGELGIWKSWIRLLREEIDQNDNFDYLHIIEDDCILTREVYKLIKNLSTIENKYDLIATDMYVNPSIYKRLNKEIGAKEKDNQIKLINGLYTGCLPSILIPREKIKIIANILEKEYNKNKPMIPIDNFLVRLQNEKAIKIAITLPFITSISAESIMNSTIQERINEARSIRETQNICYLLRKKLSIIENNNYSHEIVQSTVELIKLNSRNQRETNNIITNMVIEILEKRFLRYKYRPSLQGEPQNPQ